MPASGGAVAAPVAAGSLGHLTGRVVIGRVLRGDGRPLAGASVTLTDVSGRQVDRLRGAGLHFRNDVVTGPGGKQILFDDPSGNPIELFQPASG